MVTAQTLIQLGPLGPRCLSNQIKPSNCYNTYNSMSYKNLLFNFLLHCFSDIALLFRSCFIRLTTLFSLIKNIKARLLMKLPHSLFKNAYLYMVLLLPSLFVQTHAQSLLRIIPVPTLPCSFPYQPCSKNSDCCFHNTCSIQVMGKYHCT